MSLTKAEGRPLDAVTYEGGYRLRVEFDDGAVKVIDLEKELVGPVFEPLQDPVFFRKVAMNRETGTIEWPNGADFAPEFLYEIGVNADPAPIRKVAESGAAYGSRTK